jgi:hypothetical protein
MLEPACALSRQWLDCDSLPVHRTCCGKEQRTVKCKDLRQERSAGGLSILAHVHGRAYLVGAGDARSCRAEDYAYERHRKLPGSNPPPLAVSGAFANVTALRDNSSVTGLQPHRCTARQVWIVEDDRGVPGPASVWVSAVGSGAPNATNAVKTPSKRNPRPIRRNKLLGIKTDPTTLRRIRQ